MPKKTLDKNALGMGEDWLGNNAAFACPVCGKVYLVTAFPKEKPRACPKCGKSVATASRDGTSASIEW